MTQIELIVRGSALAATVAAAARRALDTACMPYLPGMAYVDHIEVIESQIHLAHDQGVTIRVPANVYLVTQAALMAAPNVVPAGAAASPNPITLIYEIRAEVRQPNPLAEPVTRRHSLISFISRPPDLGPLGGALGPAGPPLQDAIQNRSQIPPTDLTDVFSQAGFGPPKVTKEDDPPHFDAPMAADTVLIGDELAARFDPGPGQPVARLAPGQAWGLFIGGGTWADLARVMVEGAVRKISEDVQVQAQWQMDEAGWHVAVRAFFEVDFNFETILGDEEVVLLRAGVDLRCELSLAEPWPQTLLRMTIGWSLQLLTPLPDLVDDVARDLLEDIVEDKLDPATFGGVTTGPRQFARDFPVPDIVFGEANLRPQNVVNGPAGNVLGGTLALRPWHKVDFTLEPGRLSGPARVQSCRTLAKTGTGDPDSSPLTPYNTYSYGSVTFHGTAVLCGFEMVSATPGIDAFLRLVPGGDGESFEIRARIPYYRAQNMNAPLQLIVRTPRGVRLVDMGLPPKVELDEQGRLKGRAVLDIYTPNCLQFHDWGLLWTKLPGESNRLSVATFKPKPLEWPGWTEFVRAGHGLSVQVLTLRGLEPGELVQFRSATHAIDASADSDGSLVMPVLLQLRTSVAPAVLERASGLPLDGHTVVETLDFEHIAALPRTETAPSVALTRDGRAVLSTLDAGRQTMHIVSPDGTLMRMRSKPSRTGAGEVMLNPQPLPPEPPPKIDEMRRRWPGIIDVITSPDSNGALGVGLRDDGTQLLLNRGTDGDMRVAGRFEGPIGRLTTLGEWAVASGRAGVQVLRRLP
jgi:hypothetical protein